METQPPNRDGEDFFFPNNPPHSPPSHNSNSSRSNRRHNLVDNNNTPFNHQGTEIHRAILRELRLNNARNQNSKKYRTYLVLGIVLLILLFDNSYIFDTSFFVSFRFFLFSFIAILISLYFCSFIQRRSSRMRGNSFYYHQSHLRQLLDSQYPLINSTHLQLELMDRDFNENDYEMLLALDEDLPTRSINPELISQLPDQEVTSQELEDSPSQSCSICLEKYEVGEETKSMPCLHKFHSKCINKWLMMKGTCPICKFDLKY